LWGFLHGVLLCAYRWIPSTAAKSERAPLSLFGKSWRIFLMFNVVCLGWLFFRADSVSQAWRFIKLMGAHSHSTPMAVSMFGMIVFYAGPLALYEIWVERRKDLVALVSAPSWSRALVYTYCALMLLFFP